MIVHLVESIPYHLCVGKEPWAVILKLQVAKKSSLPLTPHSCEVTPEDVLISGDSARWPGTWGSTQLASLLMDMDPCCCC